MECLYGPRQNVSGFGGRQAACARLLEVSRGLDAHLRPVSLFMIHSFSIAKNASTLQTSGIPRGLRTARIGEGFR